MLCKKAPGVKVVSAVRIERYISIFVLNFLPQRLNINRYIGRRFDAHGFLHSVQLNWKKCSSYRKGRPMTSPNRPGFFQGTGMPDPGWWEALWPDPANVLTETGVKSDMD